MSNSDRYELENSDDADDETLRTKFTDLFKSGKGYPIERKVIDVRGRLGSLYNYSTDALVDQYCVRASGSKRPEKPVKCRIFPGDQSKEPISFLENIGFDNAVRHSIRHQTVIPSGTGRLVEYNQPINQNTRFLYYCYIARKEKLPVEAQKADKIVPPPLGPTGATHMITKILWGIEILCVIQLPRNESVNAINQLLRRIQKQLEKNRIPILLDNNDRRLIDQLTNITVFGSDTCVDDRNALLLTILEKIRDWQRNPNFHQPLTYIMQPLRWLYNNTQFTEPTNRPAVANSHIDRIEPILNRIGHQMKDLGDMLHQFPANFSSEILNQRLRDFQQRYRFLLDTHEDLQERLRKAIPDVRQQYAAPGILDEIIADSRYHCLHKNEIEKIRVEVERLLVKAILIEKLKNDRIEYINAFDLRPNGIIPTTNEAIDVLLKRFYSNENGPVILWYSGDRLKREQADRWKQIYQQLTSERQQSTERIKLVYADFTQCQQRLEKFVIVRLPGTRRDPGYRSPRSKSPSSSPKQLSRPLSLLPQQPDRPSTTPLLTSMISDRTPSPLPQQSRKRPLPPPPPPPPPPEVTEINVLLLGETGVGKSTFINAFVNYLKFETLEQAERGEPVVLIPVSFLLIVGDQYDECTVKYGGVDPNEDHEHQGQSVTQQCKSYVFDLTDRLRLRLIDTPGMRDDRGVAQDQKNMDHILTYVNNLSHLNAICLFLKPNASQLNEFFRSCIRQLLTYITPIGYNNIIFCLTNARATVSAPGDIGPILRQTLIDEHLTDIQFQKENTFCFDSDAFRYLAARKSGIDFNDFQKQECINSWTTSVKESLGLLNYILTRQPYVLQEYQSPRKAALDISMLARPLMETLRLIIYNWILSEAKLIFNEMRLNSNPVATEMCTHCARTNIVEVGRFWVAQYQPPLLKTNENQHRFCPIDGNHLLIEVLVQHQFAAEGSSLQKERWESSFQNFLLKCDRLQHFLRQQGPSPQDDPFEPILERFLEEEQQISQIRNINTNMNQSVREVLQSIKQIRQRHSQQLFDENKRVSLNEVYRIIDSLLRIPTMKEQIDNIQRSRQLIMKRHEIRLPANLIENKLFV